MRKKNNTKVLNFKLIRKIFFRLLIIFIIFLLFLTIYLDSLVKNEFKQSAWSVPAKVFARPLSFAVGKKLTIQALKDELNLLGYRSRIKAVNQGEYEQYQNTFVINVRRFRFWDEERLQKVIQITINDSVISQLEDFSKQEPINFLRLEPLVLGSFYTGRLEDRQLIHLSQLPDNFISVLLNTEDRDFYNHAGLSLSGIARAAWSNISSGELRQGGSTITQQLIKNHFLSRKRSLWRKMREAIMALLTEYHYDKQTILQAYVNEVYMGQQNQSGIYGFARASEYYFDKNLRQLNLSQVALLVGMIRGPSLYNPRKNPEKVRQRRDLVLKQLLSQGLITDLDYKNAVSRSLQVVKKPKLATSKVPAFMDYIKRELRQAYTLSELHSEGLRLFTTLDPLLQKKSEKSLTQRLKQIELKQSKLNQTVKAELQKLQGAIIVSDVATGDILAMVGDRNANYVGFNRALDAYRQTGSVIKPFIYLTALEEKQQFNLLTPILDEPFSLTGDDGSLWQPKNYNGEIHGEIELRQGLIHSHNLATARLALDVGIKNVVKTISKAGFSRELAAYPSIALGAKEMSPLEVLKLYQTLANNGVGIQASGLIAVQDHQGHLLQRYQRKVDFQLDPQATFLVRYLLTQVVAEGTAKSLGYQLKQTFAGKTGTTNDLRDSWYAGFSQDKLAVIWLGRDDNLPSQLTGASGALKVWQDLFVQLNEESVQLQIPESMVWAYQSKGFFSDLGSCKGKTLLPFDRESVPQNYKICENL